jgi:hypothetical protein
LLGPLQDNGGPTQTHALLAGSPALNAGNNAYATATDQRGFARIVGGTIDIGAFEVQPAGQVTHLSIQAPASISAGTPFAITVTALDDSGQPVTGYTGLVHFSLTGPLTGMADYTFTAADMGQHTFSNLVLRRAGAYTVGGADTDNPLITGGNTFTITPLVAAHIAFSVPSSITAGMPFAITVTVQDAYGNTVTDYTGTVHFTLTGQAMAQADYTLTATDMGSHTFTNLVLSQAGDYTLGGMDTADPTISGSSTFTITPAAADHLLFLQQPTDAAAGQTISPVIVEVVDAFGNVETSDNSDTIALSLGSNPSGGTLSGTLTVTVSGGIASFTDLSIDRAGVGYTLHATVGGGLPDSDSDPFTVTSG